MGLRVICFAWADGAVCAEMADCFYPISIVEKDAILVICRREKIDGICTIASDVAAPTVAYIAQALHLPGNTYESAIRANNKYLMREAFYKAGIKCPKFARVKEDVEVDLSTWSFPLIVKPVDRSGSLGVLRVESLEELYNGIKAAQAFSFRHEAIVEEYINGREISVEFISDKGIHYPLTITDKVTTGAPHFVELEHHQPADLSKSQYQEIYMTTEKALRALSITDGASHTEYRITEEGEIFILELGARMGGDFIGSDLVYLSTGYDFVRGVIQNALGTFEKPVFGEQAHSGVYFLSKETERLLPYFDEKDISGIVKREQMDNALKTVTCSADRSGYIIYQSDKKFKI